MKTLRTLMLFRRDEQGATAVEYGVLVALIAAVIVASVTLLGRNTNDNYRCTVDSLKTRVIACPQSTPSN